MLPAVSADIVCLFILVNLVGADYLKFHEVANQLFVSLQKAISLIVFGQLFHQLFVPDVFYC